MKKEALFLDRDGVICQMVKYESDFDSAQKISDVKLVAGIVQIIRWANEQGVPVIEISNQPGVAKGKMSREESEAIEKRVGELLRKAGARIDRSYICLHHPRGVVPELTKECDCRKPRPGLLFLAAKENNLDLSKSLFLGDKASDARAGILAGIQTVIFLHDQDEPRKVQEARDIEADFKSDSLEEVNKIIKAFFRRFTGDIR